MSWRPWKAGNDQTLHTGYEKSNFVIKAAMPYNLTTSTMAEPNEIQRPARLY